MLENRFEAKENLSRDMMRKKISLLVTGFVLLLAPGCAIQDADDANNNTDEPDEFLVSEQFKRTITQQQLLLLWAEAGESEVSEYIQYDVDLYQIIYNTVDGEGQPIEASGAILVPKGVADPGLISIQHATIFSNDEAPSVDMGISVALRKSIFSSAGYIAFLPDYIGYGVTLERLHPYQQGSTLATASYDMIRAGMEFLEDNGLADTDQPVNLIGYSEGAYATLALAQLIETTDSGIEPGFLSMGAGIYDLTGTSDFFIQNIDKPTKCLACYAYFLYSYHHTYKFPRPLSDYFQEPYDQIIADGLFNGSFSSQQIKNQLPEKGIDLFRQSFVQRYLNGEELEIMNAFADNNLFYIPDADVLLVHGEDDSVAPVFNSDDFETRVQDIGKTNFEYIRAKGVTHNRGIFPWGLETLNRLISTEKVASKR